MRLVSRRLLMFAAMLFVAGANGWTAQAYDREPPRVAHFTSEYARIGFVLDRSGELAKLRFDGSEEILVLRLQPAAGGDRLLIRDDGETVLRISALGGVTLFTPENRQGVPVASDAQVAPLTPAPPSIGEVRMTAGQIMARLRAETGQEIVFEANWNAVAGDEGARGILFDAIRNAGTALFDVSRIVQGRIGITRYLRRVRFMQARVVSISMQGEMLIVAFSIEQGLAGRPSSYAIKRQLAQIMH